MNMKSLLKLTALLLINLCDVVKLSEVPGKRLNQVNQSLVRGPRYKSRYFLFYKSNAINEKACECSTQVSCSCCETVTLVLIKSQKRLCANFMYQRNGLNIDISLDANTVRSITVTNFRPLKLCTFVPGSLFSGVCLRVLELNAFPQSLTVCPQFVITTKTQEWRINYTCVSIATELPMVNGENAENGEDETVGMIQTGLMNGMAMMPAPPPPPNPAPMGQQTAPISLRSSTVPLNSAISQASQTPPNTDCNTAVSTQDENRLSNQPTETREVTLVSSPVSVSVSQ